MIVTRLAPPIAVIVTANTMPHNVQSKGGKAWAHAWIDDAGTDAHTLWRVCLDDSGEWVDVPNPEIRADFNWSMGRRGET